MKINIVKENNTEIAIVNSSELLTDVQSALDLIATIQYETGCNYIILNKSQYVRTFDLSRLAGEICKSLSIIM